MKIAVMGAGGIGGCYGGLLAQAGNDVTLIARGAHLAAIKEKGLQLIQPEGDFTVAVAATDDPSQVGPVELVIFSVKAHQNSIAVPLIHIQSYYWIRVRRQIPMRCSTSPSLKTATYPLLSTRHPAAVSAPDAVTRPTAV